MITQEKALELFEYRDGVLYKKDGTKAGWKDNCGYIRVSLGRGKKLLAHRVIFLIAHGWLPEVIDHIDGDITNNRIDNLRACTQQENLLNAKKRVDNTSGTKGMAFCKTTNRWRVRFRVFGRSMDFGRYEDKELAELVAVVAREKYHGEFARG